MNTWNKIVAGTKFLFGGWESALEYVIGILDGAISKGDASKKVAKVYDTAKWCVGWMFKLRDYCPKKWMAYYDGVYDSVYAIVDIFADGHIELSETQNAVDKFKAAVDEWRKD